MLLFPQDLNTAGGNFSRQGTTALLLGWASHWWFSPTSLPTPVKKLDTAATVPCKEKANLLLLGKVGNAQVSIFGPTQIMLTSLLFNRQTKLRFIIVMIMFRLTSRQVGWDFKTKWKWSWAWKTLTLVENHGYGKNGMSYVNYTTRTKLWIFKRAGFTQF